MKKSILILFTLIFSVYHSNSQSANIVRITKTQIITPDTISIDTLEKGAQTFIKIIIKNDRQNDIEIKNIKTPPGTGATIKNTILKPKSQTELFVGFDSNWMDVSGHFVYKIVLETNLIKPIEINVKGFVAENND